VKRSDAFGGKREKERQTLRKRGERKEKDRRKNT
jgi:hypothetical protein